MHCAPCRAHNPDGARFCEECGMALAGRCLACGAEVTLHRPFCRACGAALDLPRAEARLDESERKQVTVLFADVKDSMAMLANRDPEEVRTILDVVLESMMEAVRRYEGTVNQVMGDGIMALFGAPVAHEDHAIRACYAALRMQQAIRARAEQLRTGFGLDLAVRIGLNSGEVVVRSIGSDVGTDYTAVGQTTNLAARMEQMATPGSILATAATVGLARGVIDVVSLGPVAVKGLGTRVELSEVIGTARPSDAPPSHPWNPFVGREVELALLGRALAQADQGHGQIVGVVGDPGVGKTRLCREFIHSLRSDDWLIVRTVAASHGKSTAYLPLIDLFKTYFQIGDGHDPHDAQQRIRARLSKLGDDLASTFFAFAALLVGVEHAEWQALDPRQRRQQTRDAMVALLFRESRARPVCLVLEDLHWIDPETQALLESLVEQLAAVRLLLLVNYRPEYEPTWTGHRSYTQIRVDPLPPASADELLDALVGEAGELDVFKRLLVERTGGNPFFLEECVRTLAEHGVLDGAPGAYRLVRPVQSIEVPGTVQAVLAARIDRLGPESKRLLQCAAGIGGSGSIRLRHVLG